MPRKLPTGIRKRGGRYYASYPSPEGRQVEEAAGTSLRQAKAYRARRIAEVEAGTWVPKSERRPRTVGGYAKTWWPKRREKIRSDEGRWLRLHIVPHLGDVALEELRARDVVRWVEQLQAKGLAARTIRNAHGVLSAMLDHALLEELVDRNVAKGLPRRTLPAIGRSKRPAFDRGQVLALLTCAEIDEGRRVAYALGALAGMRAGEVAGRTWGDIEDRPGLRALHIRTQYDGLPLKGATDEDDAARIAPIHPELELVLAGWRKRWADRFGRVPHRGDWIVPYSVARVGDCMTNSQMSKAIRRDMQTAGIELAKGGGYHSLRRFFSTACQDGGADRDVVREITHRPKGDVLEDSYTRRAWHTLCRAVLCLDLHADPMAEVVDLRAAATGQPGSQPGSDEQDTRLSRKSRGKMVEAWGIEAHPPAESLTRSRKAALDALRESPADSEVCASEGIRRSNDLDASRFPGMACPECGYESGPGPTCNVCGVAFLRPVELG